MKAKELIQALQELDEDTEIEVMVDGEIVGIVVGCLDDPDGPYIEVGE